MGEKWCDPRRAGDWSDEEIRDFFDTTNITVLTLGGMCGLTGGEIKHILMGGTKKGLVDGTEEQRW
jgi:hypothetical protein